MNGLCENCLRYGEVKGVDVGPEKGSQRDPWRERLILCVECAGVLVAGSLETFHFLFVADRLLTREDIESARAAGGDPDA